MRDSRVKENATVFVAFLVTVFKKIELQSYKTKKGGN